MNLGRRNTSRTVVEIRSNRVYCFITVRTTRLLLIVNGDPTLGVQTCVMNKSICLCSRFVVAASTIIRSIRIRIYNLLLSIDDDLPSLRMLSCHMMKKRRLLNKSHIAILTVKLKGLQMPLHMITHSILIHCLEPTILVLTYKLITIILDILNSHYTLFKSIITE